MLTLTAFRDNEVRPQPFALAYDPADFLRSLVPPTEVRNDRSVRRARGS